MTISKDIGSFSENLEEQLKNRLKRIPKTGPAVSSPKHLRDSLSRGKYDNAILQQSSKTEAKPKKGDRTIEATFDDTINLKLSDGNIKFTTDAGNEVKFNSLS